MVKDKNEDHANGTCQYRIRYASGAFQESGLTDGAWKKPRKAVIAAQDRPATVIMTAGSL